MFTYIFSIICYCTVIMLHQMLLKNQSLHLFGIYHIFESYCACMYMRMYIRDIKSYFSPSDHATNLVVLLPPFVTYSVGCYEMRDYRYKDEVDFIGRNKETNARRCKVWMGINVRERVTFEYVLNEWTQNGFSQQFFVLNAKLNHVGT